MKKKPTVSILIPTYNAQKTIKKTIKSVLNQSYKDFELIICDDNSTDKTVSIIKSFDDKRIKFFENSVNLGFDGNWNKVLTKASGSYIKILPDDDLLNKFALEKQLLILKEYPQVSIVGSKRKIIDEFDNKLMSRGKKLCSNNPCNYIEAIKNIYRFGTNPIGEPGSVLFDAKVLKNKVKFDGSKPHYIDLDFYVKILKYGDYYYIDEELSSFRIWERSYSVKKRNDNFKETKDFFDEIKDKHSFLNTQDFIFNSFNIQKNRLLKLLFYKILSVKNKLFS